MDIVQFIACDKTIDSPLEFTRNSIAVSNGISNSRDDNLLRRNFQNAIFDIKCHTLIILGRIRKVSLRKAHKILASVLTRDDGITRVSNILKRISFIIGRDFITLHNLFFAVILYLIALALYRNNDSIIIRRNR